MQLFNARAIANRIVNTKQGERRVIEAIAQDGQQVTIWRPANDPASNSIVNGSRIQIGIDSKGKASLVETPADRAAQAVQALSLPFEAEKQLQRQMTAATPVTEGQSRSAEIADYIERLGKLYGHCYKVASQQLESTPLATSEIKDVATTLFIQTTRHFSL